MWVELILLLMFCKLIRIEVERKVKLQVSWRKNTNFFIIFIINLCYLFHPLHLDIQTHIHVEIEQ